MWCSGIIRGSFGGHSDVIWESFGSHLVKASFRNQFLHQICELGVELVPALFAHYFCVIFVPFAWWHVGVPLGYPWGTPGQIRQKYHPRNLYNKSARKNEASLHGSLRPTLKNGVSPTRNHRFHECTKRSKIMKLIPKAGLLWLIMTPEMWIWWCGNDVTIM